MRLVRHVECCLYFAELKYINNIRSAFFSISSISLRFIPKALKVTKQKHSDRCTACCEFTFYALYKGLIEDTNFPPLCTKQTTLIVLFSTICLHKCTVQYLCHISMLLLAFRVSYCINIVTKLRTTSNVRIFILRTRILYQYSRVY